MSAKKQFKTVRTSAGLCDAIFEEFDLLRNGVSDASRASAVAKLSIQIIATKRLEIDTAALIKSGLALKPVEWNSPSIKLGE